jgi:methyl-accepting chemotaxis protein
MEETILTASKTVEDTVPVIDALSILLAEKLPTAIATVQTALISAQSSAQAIEGTLQILTAIPFLPMEPYNPDVPLPDALGEVATSLDPIPQSLIDMEKSLSTSQGNLTLVSTQVGEIATSVGDLRTTLNDTKQVLAQYQSVLSTLEGQVSVAQDNIGNVLNIVGWVVTVFLIWLGLAQIGLLTQGLEMVGVDIEGENQNQ